MRKAVVDVGSNSVLLLIADVEVVSGKTVVTTILETSQVTGLGRGTKTTGLLSEPGMTSTLWAVKTAFQTANELGATSIGAYATMAARIASNVSDFLGRSSSQQTPVEVLSAEEEARLSFVSVVTDQEFFGLEPLSVIDIGGHSSELVVSQQGDIVFEKSFQLGALGLREGSLRDDIVDAHQLLTAVAEIDDTIGCRFLPGQAGTAVAIGATGTNLVTVRDRILVWDEKLVHGKGLSYEDVSSAVSRLTRLDDHGRAELPGIEKGREHTIHAGALLLERFMFALGAEHCLVSCKGWRHGLIALNH